MGAARLTVRDRQPRLALGGSLWGRSGWCERVGAGAGGAVGLLVGRFRGFGGCPARWVQGGRPGGVVARVGSCCGIYARSFAVDGLVVV